MQPLRHSICDLTRRPWPRVLAARRSRLHALPSPPCHVCRRCALHPFQCRAFYSGLPVLPFPLRLQVPTAWRVGRPVHSPAAVTSPYETHRVVGWFSWSRGLCGLPAQSARRSTAAHLAPLDGARQPGTHDDGHPPANRDRWQGPAADRWPMMPVCAPRLGA